MFGWSDGACAIIVRSHRSVPPVSSTSTAPRPPARRADAHHGQAEGLDPVGQVAQVGVRAELVGERQQQDVGRRADLVDRRVPVREQHVLGVTGQPVAEGEVAGVAAALVEAA
jgi:hypothetical protein